MEKKTRAEILVSLYNEQLEVVLNREASLLMLKDMDPKKVLTTKVDMTTMQPQVITVEIRQKEMQEGLELDQARLEAFQEMLAEEESKASE